MTLPTRRIQEQCTTLDTVSTTVDAATPCDDTALTSVVVARSKALSVPPCSKVPDVEVCRWSPLLSRHGHWQMISVRCDRVVGDDLRYMCKGHDKSDENIRHDARTSCKARDMAAVW